MIEECLADAVALDMLEELAIECINKNHNLSLVSESRRVLPQPVDRSGPVEPPPATAAATAASQGMGEGEGGGEGEGEDESLASLMARLAPSGAAAGSGTSGSPSGAEGRAPPFTAGAGAGAAEVMSPESLLAQLGARGDDNDNGDGGSHSLIGGGLDDLLRPPGRTAVNPTSAVSTDTATAAKRTQPLIAPLSPAAETEVTPTHRLTLSPDGTALIVEVELPDVGSVAEIDVDLSPRRVDVHVLSAYRLQLDLQQAVDDAAAQAKFLKKRSVLRLTLPLAKP